MKILKNFGIGFAFVLMVSLYGVILYQGFFPKDPVMEQKAEYAKKAAALRMEGIKELQKENSEQHK